MKLKILVHPAEEGGFWVEVPALPGCVSEGETWEEVLANVRKAVEGWLAIAAENDVVDQRESNRRLSVCGVGACLCISGQLMWRFT